MAMSFNSLPPTFRRRNRQNLTCGVCHEVYRSPRLLPCHHSFCLDCVEGLIRINPQVFPCPQCRKSTRVPRQGALGFQLNFYIPEEDLEIERGQPQTMPCPTHNPEPLTLFCVPCDQPICLFCKLTKHENHETLDMSEAADRCSSQLEASKDRLGVTINHLSKVLAHMHGDIEAVKLKGDTLLQEVQAQRDIIVSGVDEWYKKVTEDIKDSTTSVNTHLTQETLSLQQRQDCLLQLQQRVNHALSAGSDVEKVHMEKEMRQGKGSEEELSKIKDCIPTTTTRPGVYFDHSLFTDDTLHHWLGSAVRLSLPLHTTVSETIFPVYQCGQDKPSRKVHSLTYANENNIGICFAAGSAPYFKDKQVACINDKGFLRWQNTGAGRKMYHYNHNDGKWYLSYTEADCEVLYSGNGYMLVKYHLDEHFKILRSKVKSFKPFVKETETLFQVCCENPTAFRATADGHLFAIVEKGTSERYTNETEMSVHLFRLGQSQPFATYTPSDEYFHPADVCFWREDRQIKLLVTDTYNDSIHVVRIEHNGCCFERYLAAGNGYLVHPTALDADDQGNVWIGCSGNGWILKCEKLLPGNEQAHVCDENGSEESVSGSPLIVDNASQLTETLSQLSTE